MHASISAHLSHDYLLDEETDTWGPNLEEFTQRLGNIAVKERVENMYFTYLFVLRAVMKAGSLLASIDYSTGCQGQDSETKRLMQQLVGIADCAFVDQWTTRSVLLPCNLLASGSGGLLSLPIAFCAVLTASCRYDCFACFVRLDCVGSIDSFPIHNVDKTLWLSGKHCRSAMKRSRRPVLFLLTRGDCGREPMQLS